MQENRIDRAKLLTEQRNPNTADIDRMSTLEIVDVINAEDAKVAAAVRAERENIAKAIDLIVVAFKSGGRLFHVGAGTSGRLGVLDAAECPPTYGTPRDMIQGLIAGGPDAMFRSIEGAEDRPEDGEAMLKERGLRLGDAVLGIASSGTTPFVHGALAYAHRLGARTIFLTCNPNIAPPVPVDVTIRLLVGPEVVTGSTRMKAGTATKLVLNTISTAAMVKMGKVYENLMVDLKAWNEKLRDRARRIVMTLTGLDADSAQRLLDSAQGHVKAALVMHHLGIGYDEATDRLRRADGFVRRALAERLE